MAQTIGSIDLASLKNLRDDVTQYFWFESNSSSAWGSGAHVTLYPESQFTDSTSSNYMKGQNIIMNTDGFSIRNGLLPMMVLDNDSLDFNAVDTTQGTYTTMATFGLTGATIGQTSGAHIQITSSGGVGIYNAGTNVAQFDSTARIGTETGARAVTTSTGLDIYNSSGQRKASYGSTQYIYGGNNTYPYIMVDGSKARLMQSANNYANVNSNGLQVYKGGVQSASFGENAVLGAQGKAQTMVSPSGINITTKEQVIAINVDSSGTTQTTARRINVNASLAYRSSSDYDYKDISLSSIASGTVITFFVTYSGEGYSKTFTVTRNTTNQSATYTSADVNFSWSYTGSTSTIRISASQGDNIIVDWYSYSASTKIPLVELNGDIKLNGTTYPLTFSQDTTTKTNISIAATTNASGNFSVAKTGKTPIAFNGWDISNSSSGGANGSMINVYSMYLNGSSVYYEVRNTASSAAKIDIKAYIEYINT